MAITAQPECEWTVAVQSSMIAEVRPTSGQGPGQVEVRVNANPQPSTRQGSVQINGVSIPISQTAAPCRFTVNPGARTVAAAGGDTTFDVAAMTGCTWTAGTEAPWLRIASGANGNGNGTVAMVVSANTGVARSTTVTIAGQGVTVLQEAVSAPTNCTYTLSAGSQTVSNAGGPAAPVNVSTGSNCSWAAGSNVDWITVTGPAVGTGNGTVSLSVAANSGPERAGIVTIGGQPHTITQAGAPTAPPPPTCSYSLSSASGGIAAAGGSVGPIGVSVNSGCAWTAVSNASWITVAAGASGNGGGQVTLSVAANTGAQRSGTVTIAGQTYTVTQSAAAAPSCDYSINPTSGAAGAIGGVVGPVAVTTAAGCAWTASSNVNWIAVSTGASGNGPGNVTLTIGANTGPFRSGTVTVAGKSFTVNQDAVSVPCSFTVSPMSGNVDAAGGAVAEIDVATASGCSWTAVSNAAWITVKSGASGSGSGKVTLEAAANTGGPRNGTVTIAGRTFTLTQSAPQAACAYSINPTSGSINALGGNVGNVAVTTTAGCEWTATSNASWITVGSGASGSGSGTVGLSAALNIGGQRTGTVTIAGQTYTLVQAATLSTCTYAINPTSQNAAAAGGSGSTSVSTQTNCAWTAVSNDSWITVSTGATGNGNGPVSFAIAANTGGARTGTLTIAGRTFTVTQAAACTYSINPTSRNTNHNPSVRTFSVTATAGCSWTAVSNNTSWLTVTGGTSGTGNGTVTYSIAVNNSPQDRTGTITVAGLTHTVNQDGK